MAVTLFYPLENRREISAHNEKSSVTSTTAEPTTESTDTPTTTSFTTTKPLDQDDTRTQSKLKSTTMTTPTAKTQATTTIKLATTSASNETTSTTMSTIQDHELVNASRAFLDGTQNHGLPRNGFYISKRLSKESS